MLLKILIVIGILILALVVYIFIESGKIKKRKAEGKVMEEANKAPQEKLPFLALGNIFLGNEPNKTLKGDVLQC